MRRDGESSRDVVGERPKFFLGASAPGGAGRRGTSGKVAGAVEGNRSRVEESFPRELEVAPQAPPKGSIRLF